MDTRYKENKTKTKQQKQQKHMSFEQDRNSFSAVYCQITSLNI